MPSDRWISKCAWSVSVWTGLSRPRRYESTSRSSSRCSFSLFFRISARRVSPSGRFSLSNGTESLYCEDKSRFFTVTAAYHWVNVRTVYIGRLPLRVACVHEEPRPRKEAKHHFDVIRRLLRGMARFREGEETGTTRGLIRMDASWQGAAGRRLATRPLALAAHTVSAVVGPS